ncbi:unnamed protein product [Spirodela intermedia]|uniref:Potassium channel domain-containing protein n=1 Tax=Spirodela intermedia TaxID=51605 RepID=A0A7I8JMA5_SPIIN|nr:unnamed protein product [Spirodela intermedia]CAA6671297.1 unnamed protein product [Spirodela intermedia]
MEEGSSRGITSPRHTLLHRSHSAPSIFVAAGGEASPGSDDDGGGLGSSPSEKSFVKLASAGVVIYLVCGVLVYVLTRGSFEGHKTTAVVDGFYFSVVTLCTIGYGDIVPNSEFTRLFTCSFILFGFGGLLVTMVDGDRLSAALQTYVMDVKKRRMRVRMKVVLAVAVVAVCIALGTCMARLLEGLSWLDSFYLSVTSVTTVGYGDIAFKTVGGRIFAVVWLLVSTLAVARAFLYLVELRFDRRSPGVAQWFLRKKMTFRDLVAADLNNDGVIRNTFYIYSCVPFTRGLFPPSVTAAAAVVYSSSLIEQGPKGGEPFGEEEEE